ncbi:putative BTB/POZ domain, NPH3 domain, NPH3/RPT2-like family protein [Dioscorea sansibarensis]
MRGWPELGVVDTIYEEEQEDEEGEVEEQEGSKYSPPSITPSPTITPSPQESSSPRPLASLQSRVEAWSEATGCKPDAVIQVHGQSFHLHKDPIISRSCYLKRRLTGSSDVIIAPPLPVTAATFAEIAAFFYGSDVVLTPLNIASVRVAAECLEMEGLVGMTETYLNEELAGESGSVGIVLRSCLEMIPNAEAVTIAGRCVEALASEEGGAGGGGEDGIWIEGLVGLEAEEFLLIAGTMRARVSQGHDVLYRIVNRYLEHNAKLSEEEKNRICNLVDCTKLSHQQLLHLVQNPSMPLRFIVQAMLMDQLYTRQALCHRKHFSPDKNNMNMTLGEILKRDAALRQAANIKKTMEDTSFRLESLERELAGLRRRLRWSEERSESFSFMRYEEEEEEQGGGKGAVHVIGSPERGWKGKERNGNGLGRRLLHGLRKVFRPVLGREEDGRRWSCKGGEEMVVVVERRGGHRRNSSFS